MPVNINKQDHKLFIHEEYKKIKKSRYFIKKNLYTHQSKIKRYKYFNCYSNYWRMSNFWIRHKVKFFLDDILSFIFKDLKDKEIIHIEKGSWVIDQKSWKYMHWFSDALQRIELISHKIEEYPVLLTNNYFNFHYIKSSLDILDIPYIEIDREKTYKIKSLLITSHVAPAGNYDVNITKSLSKKFKKSISQNKSEDMKKRYWISRQNAAMRKIVNFSEIKSLIEEFNFEIINLEDYSLVNQIKMLNNSEVIAGLQGAGLTNIFFMNKNTKLLEIRDENDNHNNCYFSLSSALDINFYYCKSNCIEPNNFHSSDYIVDPSELKKVFLEMDLN